ncbi:helix-turn-helix domain-containing protein [Nonomuraea montanisoli]
MVLTGRRYRLHLTADQEAYAEQVGGTCRSVWTGTGQDRVRLAG